MKINRVTFSGEPVTKGKKLIKKPDPIMNQERVLPFKVIGLHVFKITLSGEMPGSSFPYF